MVNIMPMVSRIRRTFAAGLRWEIGLPFIVQPKFISNVDALSRGPTVGPLTSLNDQYAYLREASLKLTLWNVALEFGRGTQWWGPGYHGSLLLTDHAFPLDMIKLGSDETFRLPWFFSKLGDWKINSFLARLEGDQTFPHEKIFGFRLNYLPTSWLELGLTRLTQFDGQGSGAHSHERWLTVTKIHRIRQEWPIVTNRPWSMFKALSSSCSLSDSLSIGLANLWRVGL